MPTVTQLPLAGTVSGADLLVIGQQGTTVAAPVSAVLSGLQTQISVSGEVLLGRESPLAGPVEPISVGQGLVLANAALTIDGAVVAPLASPAFTGTPTAPTPAAGDNSTALATTAFVQEHITPGQVILTGDVTGSGMTGAPVAVTLPNIVAPGTFDLLTVNAKGQVIAGQATGGSGAPLPVASATQAGIAMAGTGISAAADGTFSLADPMPGLNGSALRVASTLAGALPRALAETRGEVIRVSDLLGSKPDGVDATAAFVMALGLAANVPGSTIELCEGNWNLATLNAQLAVPARTTIRGAGRHQTRITWPDTGTFSLFGAASSGAARLADIAFADFTVAGSWAANFEGTQYPFLLRFVDGLRFSNVCVEYSRVMGLVARNCTDVAASGCVVRWCARDGISFAECSGVTVEGCTVEHCDDDAIAVHSDIYDPGFVRRSVVVANNRVFDCQGLKILAPRGALVVGNVIDRCRSQGISFATNAADGSQTEGVSAAMASLIAGNVITNVINRANIDNLNQGAPGIVISGASARPGSLGVIPGEAAASGAVADPYPYVNANAAAATTATGGSFGIIVANNLIARTLPACNGSVTAPVTYAKWSDFGAGQMFTRSGWVDPSLAEADLRDHAIEVSGGVVRDVMISGNVVRGMVSGLALLGAARLENIVFRSNQVVDCLSYGVVVATTATLRAYVEENLFDLDPFLKHPNRGPNGTWLANGDPTGIKAQAGGGVAVRRNVFRNLCRDSDHASDSAGGNWLFEGNVVEADPVAAGFSTANKGVGYIRNAAGTMLAQADSNPASATFGQTLTMPGTAGSAMPGVGKWLAGHFVRNAAPALSGGLVNLGWARLTTGANNVLGTDWAQALAVGGSVGASAVLAGPAGGSGVPAFRQLAAADVSGAAPVPTVTSTYAASGAIAPGDTLALVNSAAAVSMTLGAGTADGHPIIIKRYGAGTVTLTATIDGVAGAQVVMNAPSLKESLSLAWSAALSSWLMI